MWGPLRACSCLYPWSKGVGLVTRENCHGMWGEGRNKGPRRKQSLEEKAPEGEVWERPPNPDSHLPPGSKKTGARWAHWPADDTPFLFAGGWAVTQGGSQWERRRWLYQLMLKKTRGSCLYSHPFGPLHLQQLPHSHPHSHSKMPRAFGGTDSPSFVTWPQAHRPIWVLGATRSMTGPAPPPPATTPWMLCYLP